MTTRLTLLFMVVTLLCSCRHKCDDIVKPANLKPIDWNGWNDAYDVGYTFYDNREDICYDHNGDTIMCYGHIARFLYEDYPSIGTSGIWLESGNKQQGVEVCFEIFGHDTDSLKRLLNSSSHSDTCFVTGILSLFPSNFCGCYMVYAPLIRVNRLDDIHFNN